MKKFFEYLALISLFSFWGIMLTNKDQTREMVREVKSTAQKTLKIDRPCSKPLEYSIGRVDPKFGVSENELERMAHDAADFWNAAEGKTLLSYNPASTFKINLIYDDRQEQSNATIQLEENLQELEEENGLLKKQYDSLSADYKKRVDAFNEDLAEYKKDLKEYNKEVSYWNSQGGAPEDIYNKLRKEKDALDVQYKKINKESSEINALANKTNSIVKKENQIVASYNDTVSTYKSQYGDVQEFEKGVFSGEEISIYQFKAANDLRLTLIHEFGHYLGLDHAENSKSIMYYLIGDQDVNSPVLTMEDDALLEKICESD